MDKTIFSFIATTNPQDITDPEHTLGIEVTTPAVVERCKLGNLDGQHGGVGRGSWDGTQIASWLRLPDGSTADRAAVAIASHVYAPLKGTTLATTRPDLDSIAAMALLVISRIGLWPAIGSREEDALRDRVRAVAEADAFVPAAAWSPSPLPTEANPWSRAGSVDSSEGLAHLGMICSPRRGDVGLPLAERVATIALWLLFGEPIEDVDGDGIWPAERGEVAKIREACGCAVAREHRHLANVILGAKERILVSRRALAAEAQRPGAVVVDDGIAVVKVAHAGAMGLGYCGAPVVVAFDQAGLWGIEGLWDLGLARGGEPEGKKWHPIGAIDEVYPSREAAEATLPAVREYHFIQQAYRVPALRVVLRSPRKVTIAAYAPKYLNVPALKERLCTLEPGWGGGATILGSPQNDGTKLDEAAILEAVRASLSPS